MYTKAMTSPSALQEVQPALHVPLPRQTLSLDLQDTSKILPRNNISHNFGIY